MSVGAPQQVLSGKYRLERELGRGGMGSVWLAQHLTLRSPVAIKLIDPSIAQNPEALSRFLREAQAAASLRSPHVVQILDHGVDHGVPFIVMELLEGESLAARLERERRLSPADTARIMTQVARAVARAHEAGIIHRDLKPDNIYLVRNDEDEVAKVLDFGVAKSSAHGMGAVSSATRTGSVLGTPYYMSPEQAEGAKAIDHRSDLWALGVIAWECLLGARPFEAETLGGLLLAICAREIPVPSSVGHVPPGFDAWFARACSRSVSQRFDSAKELAQELRTVCSGGANVGGGYAPQSGYAPPAGFGPSSGPHGPSVQASSVPLASSSSVPLASSSSVPLASSNARPLASTTGHLSLSSSQEAPKKKSAGVWLALGGFIVLAAAAGAFFALRGGHEDTAASAASVAPAAATSSPAPAPPAEPEAVAPAAPPGSAAPAPAPAPAAVPQVAIARPRTTSSRPSKAEKATAAPAAPPAPAPAPTPPPAAPAPTPAAKPRVNLGI